MYGKIFASMYDGSLYGNWQAIVTFQQMIVLCGPDGVVDMTPQALAARTSIPLEIIKAGLEALESPDQYSRTPDHDGRRIERLDEHRPWGWRIVNYRKYRSLVDAETVREQNRIRQQRKRERDSNDASRSVTVVTPSNAKSRQAEAEAEVNTSPPKSPASGGRRGRQLSGGLFDRFWSAYPRKASRGQAERAFAAISPDEQLVARMCAGIERARTSDQWQRDGGQFIPYPATWLRARGWEDEAPPTAGQIPDWMARAI